MKKQPLEIPKKVSVICLGNICRSPVGEYLLRNLTQQSEKQDIRNITLSSAGIQGGNWDMHHFSRNFLYQKGIKSTEFQSIALSKAYLEDQDIVLVLEGYMKREILSRYFGNTKKDIRKRMKQKIFTLREYAGDSGDIEDPFGMEREDYMEILKDIEKYCDDIAKIWEKHKERIEID